MIPARCVLRSSGPEPSPFTKLTLPSLSERGFPPSSLLHASPAPAIGAVLGRRGVF